MLRSSLYMLQLSAGHAHAAPVHDRAHCRGFHAMYTIRLAIFELCTSNNPLDIELGLAKLAMDLGNHGSVLVRARF